MKPNESEQLMDNELDIRGLCRALWSGKIWIVGIGALFGLVALASSYLMEQEWGATAIMDKPTVNMLGGYYSQRQFLRNLDQRLQSNVTTPELSIAEESYNEFVMQLAAYDTRRDFWLQSQYFQARKEGDAKADAALLDELIADIQFTPRDIAKNPNDSVKLTAETAADANMLLRQYVTFASLRAAEHLDEELQGAWAARTVSLKAQVKRQEEVAKAVYQRELSSVEAALKIASQQGIDGVRTSTPAQDVPASDMFLLGRSLLQARFESLQASGPTYDVEYDQNRAMLNTLNVGPVLDAKFQTYRYLRTPEEPVKRDSPRRAFMLIMWGAIGVLVGAGVALVRRPRAAA